MKIGVVGIGNIAKKAYLSTYSTNRNQAEFLFSTRNDQEKVKAWLKEKYGFHEFYPTVTSLIENGIKGCFIHSATKSHYQIAKECLQNGIHVYMDKPVSESLDETKELMAMARDENLILMAGFNRRFAPFVNRLKEIPQKRIINLRKNVSEFEQLTDVAVYDMFSHLVDTAVYLMDQTVDTMSFKIAESENMGKY
ncbi:Gfo/Idh/MocA family oxidoreductase [Lachnospiraceae bacterium 54-53]